MQKEVLTDKLCILKLPVAQRSEHMQNMTKVNRDFFWH